MIKYFINGFREMHSSERIRVTVIIYLYLVTGNGLLLFFATKYMILGYHFHAGVLYALFLTYLVVGIYHSKTKNYKGSALVMTCCVFSMCSFLTLTSGIDKSGLLWNYIFPIIALIITDFRKGLIFCVLLLLIILLSFYVFDNTALIFSENYKLEAIMSYLTVCMFMFIFEYVRLRTFKNFVAAQEEVLQKNSLLEQYNEELMQQKEELVTQSEMLAGANENLNRKNSQITNSISYAKTIQDAILPGEDLIRSYLPDSFVFFRPRDIVSGDFYWFAEQENNLLIAVADCTGHGVPGAFMSMIGNTLLNEITNANPDSQPSTILSELCAGVENALNKQTGETDRKDDGMEITLCSINKKTNEIDIAGAGQRAIVFIDGEMQLIEGSVYTIGGRFKPHSELSFSSTRLKPVKTTEIYLFTDGYIDQFGGANNIKFMISRFKNTLTEIHSLPMEQQKQIIDENFTEWKDHPAGKCLFTNAGQLDDVLVMGIRLSIV